ncbi:hypothetical protein [Streptomyces palmae]|uniref:Uncharacterized protein n=1 Tax=Streptomyces palmae TaxID=1701085 RepID=A0A4Z0H7S1_9ACTN|nr:hypothetical protein [Streptomyces palmae]TGB10821.1 hypothetical protein E4099_12465 [Streptomyces palmae]
MATTMTPLQPDTEAAADLPAHVLRSHTNRLLAYITTCVSQWDWHRAEDLAQDAWLYALRYADTSHTAVDTVSGVPEWLARSARIVIRRYLSPVPTVDWEPLQQILSPTEDWPEQWHTVLAEDGQEALLHVAAAELAAARTTAADVTALGVAA